jgi:hypothetical protein
MVAGPILNITARGLSAGAKVILKQLKTLMKKSNKTTKDKEKINKLKKELNADKTVKDKKKLLQDKQIKAEVKEGSRTKTISKRERGEAKNQATRYESGRKQEIDREYYEGLPREMKKAGNIAKTPKQIKKQVRKVVAEEFKKYGTRPGKKGFSTGGLSSKKKYANPVTFVDNLKK